ncbi:hypothetical protein SteCoe_21222 [Stentor coeruleus]|uniref:RING-type E3 ubiquitin transferase n=1 Tax=Stentor coeruleus TaxID=5963 RepID=A0A1R2BPV6_9CILI|nr:hypothetical protein SteCoe_21222 [Stentor coeruleus]
MKALKLFIDFSIIAFSIAVVIFSVVKWNSLNAGYPTTAWEFSFLFILISGRILLCYTYRMRLGIVIIFRLFYFLLTNIWAIVGVIFYIKATENSTLDSAYKAFMIVSIIICFIISFILRRGSLRIPYRQIQTYERLVENHFPQRNLKIIDSWIVKYPNTEKEMCTVCIEEFKFKQKLVKLPNCGHFFHKKCIKSWMKVKTVCPICKSDYLALLTG